ncbi:hypothetical protein BGW41_006847, partial [Actinomortierella wolfii]
NVMHHSPIQTAIRYIVHGVGAIIAVALVTKLVIVVRTKIIMVVGWLVFIASGIVFAQIKEDSSYWSIAFPALILNFLGVAPVWLSCQINAVMDAADEDQGVVGSIYNSAFQIGGPIGIAITNVIAEQRNPPGTTGAALLVGYRATYYTYAIIGGVGLVTTLILAANQDPQKLREKPSENVDVAAGDNTAAKSEPHEAVDHDLEHGKAMNESTISSLRNDKSEYDEKLGFECSGAASSSTTAIDRSNLV